MHLFENGLNSRRAGRWSKTRLALGLSLGLSVGLGPLAPRPTEAAAPVLTPPEDDIRRDATVHAVEKVMPAVVNINTEEVVAIRDPFENLFRDFFDPYYRRRQPNTQFSLGSGVIIDEEGYILTNYHVVGRARRVWITLHDGRVFEADKVAVNSATDVALIKIRSKENETFASVPFASEDDLLLGETVLALGNPFGLGGSVSRGILSSKTRRPPTGNGPLDVPDWLQTDAAINPGNSGGPLTNLRGELIGINVAVLSEAQGIGFAIPVKRVAERLAEIYSPESLDGLWFGARIRPANSRLSITLIQPQSPADKAGLRIGDQILQINGKSPRSFIHLVNLLRAGRDKQTNVVVVQRGRERKSVNLRLAPESSFFNAGLIRQKTGLSLQELTPRLAQSMGLGGVAGLLIAEVESRSPSAQAEMKHGMVLTAVDGQPTSDVVPLARYLADKAGGDKIRCELIVPVQRGALLQLRQAAVEIPLRP